MRTSSLTHRSFLLVGALAGILLSGVASAQTPGTLDTSFFSGHMQSLANNTIRSIALQSDGKAFIGGSFTNYNGTTINRIARLNADGSLDTSRNSGGSGANNNIQSIIIQPDGKILIGGDFTNYNGTTINRITRLNADGSIDTSRNSGGSAANGTIRSMALQPDNKILIGGDFTNYNGTTINRITRLNADGSIDTSRNSGGSGANNNIQSIIIQPDGKILIGGDFTNYNGTTINRIARLNADGSLDTSRNSGGSAANGTIRSIALQSDGKAFIGGSFTNYNGTTINRIARLNADGSLDTSRNSGGSGANNNIQSIIIQPDGKILIGGFLTNYNGVSLNRIVRLNADGSIDTSRNSGGSAANGAILSIALQFDNKSIVGGDLTSYNGTTRNRITRLNADGSLDTSRNSGGSAANATVSPIIQADGKILIIGSFTSYNSIPLNRIARLNADGSIDTSRNSGGSGTNNSIRSIALQPDGKILIGGSFTNYNGTTINRIARLNTDGSIDTSRNSGGSGANNDILSIITQPDGKILIGGSFTNYNGSTLNRIVRLNADGSIDTSRNSGGSAASSTINSIALQSDGKVIIGGGGGFTSYNGVSINRIARLNADGSIDTSRNSGGSAANNEIRSISLQSDGKIIIGGFFTSYNDISLNRIARLNTDGSIDTSRNSGGSAANGGNVISTIIQPNGKIIIVGSFTSYNDITSNYIARLNNDGSFDTTFNSGGNGADFSILSIALQADGKMLIGGDFVNYNGKGRFRLARLYGDTIIGGFAPCLGGTGTVTFSSFGFCLQSAGQTEQVPLFNLSTNTPLVGRIINTANLFKVFRIPYRVAPTDTSSTTGSVRYVGVPLTIPALSAESSGDVYIVPFKPIEIGTGGTIEARYDQ